MTIEELNKLIKEELEAYLGEEEGGDDIEVTTDEPEVKDDEALDTLRQIFNMLKPIVEPEGDEESEMDMDSDEGKEDMEDEADEDMKEMSYMEDEKDEDMKEGKDDEKDEDMKEGKDDEKDEDMKEGTNSLNESFDQLARFKKLANIK